MSKSMETNIPKKEISMEKGVEGVTTWDDLGKGAELASGTELAEKADVTEGENLADEAGLTDEEVLRVLNGGERGVAENSDENEREGAERRQRKAWGKTGKRVMGALRHVEAKSVGSEGNGGSKKAESNDGDKDEEALEAAFREVTLDEVLAERPEEKSPAERVAEKLGNVRLAEVVIGAINEAREHKGQYYDYLRTKADEYEVDYDDLLQLVRERVKAGYDDKKDQIKFYYPLSRKDFVKAAEAGKLERSDDKRKRRGQASDLRFSQDTVVDGEVVLNGFGAERGAKSEEVTLVFGGDLIDEPSFDALLPDAVAVDEVDLQKCLAVVSEGPKLDGVLAKNNLLVLAVRDNKKGEGSWREETRDVATLRKIKEIMVGDFQKNESLRRGTLTEVDKEAAEERMRKLAEKVKPEDWDEVFERFRECETDAEYEGAEKDTFARLLEAIDVKGASEVRYLGDDEEQKCYLTAAQDEDGYYVWIATLSREMVPSGVINRSVEVLAHEAMHAREVSLIERMKAGEELSEEEWGMAEKYEYNLDHYIPQEVDRAGNMQQIMEVDAQKFGEVAMDAFYDRYEERHKTPLQKVVEGLQEVFKGEKGSD